MPVFAVPNKTVRFQMIPFSDDSTLNRVLNNFGLVSNEIVFECINEFQNLKKIHSNLLSYGNRVMATGPKKTSILFVKLFCFQESSSKIL